MSLNFYSNKSGKFHI